MSKAKAKRKTAKAKERTPRLRYLEPPTKKDGQPFFALRVNAELLAAFRKHAKAKGVEATALVRSYMARVTGVSADNEDEE